MMLSYRQSTYHVPHTSRCIIHTTGLISDGDKISITSPVFTSINYISGAINITESFDVTARVLTETKTFVNNEPDGSCYATLVCDDDDIFNMYVRIQ
jgi:hypothetical protein